jgi:hypothetical protein
MVVQSDGYQLHGAFLDSAEPRPAASVPFVSKVGECFLIDKLCNHNTFYESRNDYLPKLLAPPGEIIP